MGAVFVHLSDIHFGQERRSGEVVIHDDARAQLVEDASSVITAMPSGRASGVIVTGDIAYGGKRAEYVVAGRWLDELTQRVGCSASDLQMVPGNHDIDIEKHKGSVEWMLQTIQEKGEEQLDNFLSIDTDREALYARFSEYRTFSDAYQCPLDCNGTSSMDRRVELAEGRALRFVRLNSALVCNNSGNECGRLLLGARQRVMKEAAGEELVVLCHHPLRWLADSDDARKFIRSRARVLITGHEHVPSVTIDSIEPGRDLMVLAAGAATPPAADGEFTYSYNILEFDWDPASDALVVSVRARTWNDDMKRFEASGDVRDFVLGSPNFRLGSRVQPGKRDQRDEMPTVELVSLVDEDLGSAQSESEYQTLYLRFFRDLPEGDRLRILFALKAVPAGLSASFNHETESRFFRSIFDSDRVEELRQMMQEALGNLSDLGGET